MYCKNCGLELESDSNFCESCGMPVENSSGRSVRYKRNQPTQYIQWSERTDKQKRVTVIGFSILVLCVLMVVLAVVLIPRNSGQSSPGITYENFEKIENGMTYSEVCDILGSKGTLDAGAGSGEQSLEYYSWTLSKPIGYASITVSFQNGKVAAKLQVGLN